MSRLPGRSLVFVRHGETTGGSRIRYYGQTDVPLSDLGREQMRAVATICNRIRLCFDIAITSTLARCREAASLIAPGVQQIALAGFDEICFGEWEGLTEQEIKAADPLRYQLWREHPENFTYPGGEAVPVFRQRVWQTFEQLRPNLPRHTLFVLHKGVIRTLLTHLMEGQEHAIAQLDIALGSVHVVCERQGRWEALLLDGTLQHASAALGECVLGSPSRRTDHGREER